MLLRAHRSGFLLILACCCFDIISSLPQRKMRQNVAVGSVMLVKNQTSSTTMRTVTKLTESYLPAIMQVLAYHIELLQYEPLHSTTVEPPFTVSTTPLTFPDLTSSSSIKPSTQQQPVTWWSPTTTKPTTWWSPPSTTSTTIKSTTLGTLFSTTTTTQAPTTKPVTSSLQTTTDKPWWDLTSSSRKPGSWGPAPTTTQSTIWPKPSTTPWTTRQPLVSTSTPSWWNRETTPYHKPGYFAPERQEEPIDHRPPGNVQYESKPNGPQIGDLSLLSISSYPHFEYFVKPNSKTFNKKPEYEFLHQYPAELLQDIENEPYQQSKVSEQEIINEFRRVYDDFFTRVRVFAPVTGKKRVPPTRPYVLFLIIYDLFKREAKRLSLQEFTGYSESMLVRLQETSKYSAERQLYTLMDRLLDQKSLHAADIKMRINEIMTDLANPNSQTAKALHVLPPLNFD